MRVFKGWDQINISIIGYILKIHHEAYEKNTACKEKNIYHPTD